VLFGTTWPNAWGGRVNWGGSAGGWADFGAGWKAYGFGGIAPVGGGVEGPETVALTSFHARPIMPGSSFFGGVGDPTWDGPGGCMITFAHGEVGTDDFPGCAAAGKYELNVGGSGSAPRAVASGVAGASRAAGP
jgi:hypothetical protein